MKEKKLLDQMRDLLRTKHYSIRTERSYIGWAKRFILFHGKRHPSEMGEKEIAQFLTYLACQRKVAASTQNQALNALVFLYCQVLRMPLDEEIQAVRAKRPQRIPTVLSDDEAQSIIAALAGIPKLQVRLLYGSGLRLMECVRLRVKDIDFAMNHICVRDGKGNKDRVTLLPQILIPALKEHMEHIQLLHTSDLERGYGSVYLPYALARKYPRAEQQWGWQYVFPSKSLSCDPRSGKTRRHHIDEGTLRKAVSKAARIAGIHKPVSCHTFGHSFATRLLEKGYDIRTVQELLGHKDVNTTMIYTHVINKGPLAVKSPID